MCNSSPSKFRNLAINLALVVLSVLITMVIVEVAVRIAGYKSIYAGTQFFDYDSVLGWRLRPNLEGPFERPQFRTYVKINEHGLRDRDYTYEKPVNNKRIVVLGDSFVWGYGVNGDKVFTGRIAAELEGVDVINAGVTAYGTAQELLWLEREGVKYHPDLVIVVLYKNDLVDNVTSVYNGYHRPVMILRDDGSLQLSGVPCQHGSIRNRLRKSLVRYSALTGILLRSEFRFLLRLEGPVFGGATPRSGEDNGGIGVSSEAYAVRLTIALVDRIGKVAEAHSARVLVVAICHDDDACKDVVKGLSGKNLPVLALDEQNGYSPADMVIPGDEHWNAAGHEFVARSISEFIKAHNLLP